MLWYGWMAYSILKKCKTVKEEMPHRFWLSTFIVENAGDPRFLLTTIDILNKAFDKPKIKFHVD